MDEEHQNLADFAMHNLQSDGVIDRSLMCQAIATLRAQLAEVTRERDEAQAQINLLTGGVPCVVMRFSDYDKLKGKRP